LAKKVYLSFKETEQELTLYEWVMKKLSFSAYIKELIIKDMQKSKKESE
jgi:hypothetical protein